MNLLTLIAPSADPAWNPAALLLADVAAKGVAVLLLAAIVAWLLRKRSAAARHLVWQFALAALLALPAVTLLVPRWRLPLLPPAATAPAESRPLAPVPDTTAFVRNHVPPAVVAAPAADAADDRVEVPAPPVAARNAPPVPSHPVPVGRWVLATWLAGAALVVGKLAVGLAAVARLCRKATPIDDESWTTLRADLSHSIGLTRTTPLLRARGPATPMAVGLLRPAILLPAESDGWPEEKRRMVLLHELAHVRRRDCLTNAVAHAAVAIHWFNPLAWVALRRLVAERERACDDAVLSAGSLASRYAGCLLDIARDLHAGGGGTFAAAAAIPMARPTQLEGRLLAILDAARPRRAATRRAAAAGLALTAMLLLPLAAVRLTAAPPAETKGDAAAVYKPIVPESGPTSDVTGVVTDESGRPVADVGVVAVHGWGRNAERRTIQTDAEGRFAFKDLAPEYWFFSVGDPRFGWEWDHERALRVPAPPEDLPVSVKLYQPRTVRGTVVDDAGRPVADVRVNLANQTLPGHDHPVNGHHDVNFLTARTDAAGHFTMDRLRPGKATFVLEHPDYAVTFAWADVDGQEPTFTIDKGLTLRGRVVHDGRPVAGVRLQAGINESHRPVVDWRGTTDADGRFEVPRIRPREAEYQGSLEVVAVSVQDPKWTADAYDVYQTGPRELPAVTIEARPREAGKKPAPGRVDVGKSAAVELSPKRRQPAAAAPGTVRVHVPGAGDGNYMLFVTALTTAADDASTLRQAKGETVTFEGVAPGKYVISINGDFGTSARPPKTIDLASGQALDVTLDPGPGQLRGTVRSGGKPVAGGGHVSWFPDPEAPVGVYQGGAEVRPDGTYALDGLTEGRYHLTYRAPGSLPNTFAVDVKPGAGRFDLDLPTGRLEGKLAGFTPKPKNPNRGIGEIFVRRRGVPPMNGNAGAFVDPGPDGRFTVDHLPPGQYTVTGYDLATTATVDREGAVAAATLSPPAASGQIGGTLTGHLPAAAAPDDWNSIQVTAFPRDDRGYDFGNWTYSTRVTAKGGTYRLRNLPPGTYGLLATGGGSGNKRIATVWFPAVEVRENLSREFPIDVPAGRVVSLAIPRDTDPARPIPSGWRLRTPAGEWLDSTLLTGSSPVGEVALPLGQYTLEVDYGPRGRATQTITVEPDDGPQKVTIAPPPAAAAP